VTEVSPREAPVRPRLRHVVERSSGRHREQPRPEPREVDGDLDASFAGMDLLGERPLCFAHEPPREDRPLDAALREARRSEVEARGTDRDDPREQTAVLPGVDRDGASREARDPAVVLPVHEAEERLLVLGEARSRDEEGLVRERGPVRLIDPPLPDAVLHCRSIITRPRALALSRHRGARDGAPPRRCGPGSRARASLSRRPRPGRER